MHGRILQGIGHIVCVVQYNAYGLHILRQPLDLHSLCIALHSGQLCRSMHMSTEQLRTMYEFGIHVREVLAGVLSGRFPQLHGVL